jgi:hypothetical protein
VDDVIRDILICVPTTVLLFVGMEAYCNRRASERVGEYDEYTHRRS